MLVNICTKFHALNGLKVTERTRFCLRNCYLQSSKGHNSKGINTKVMVLAFCTSSNIGIKHDFPFINIRKVLREVLKTEDEARGFQHLPRDLATINE